MRAAARRTAEWTRQLGAVVTGAKVLAVGGPGAGNPGTAGRPATRAGPAAATGARTVRPPPAPARTGTARGPRTPAAPTRASLAPRTPPVRAPPAPTRVRLLGPLARDTRERWRTRPRPRNRGPGGEPAGAGANQRGAAIPGPAPGGQPRPPRALGGGPPSRENAWRRPERRPGQEIQGGPGNSPASSAPQPRGSLWSAGAFRTAGPGGRGPVRGFPPAPGAPDPVYPPGQFSPWNASALRAASAAGRACLTAGPAPESSEPGYSQLAVSDPSADATATQTWVALDDAHLDTAPGGVGHGPADAPARPGWDQSGHPLTGESDQTGPRGFFEPPPTGRAPGPAASAGALATPGFPAPRGRQHHPDMGRRDGATGYPGDTGFPGGAGFPGEAEYPGQPGFPGATALATPANLATLAGRGSRIRSRSVAASGPPRGRLAARQGRSRAAQDFPAASRASRSTGPRPGPGRHQRLTVRGPGPQAPQTAQAAQPGPDVAHAAGHDGGRHRPDHRGLPALRQGPGDVAPPSASPGRQATASSSASPAGALEAHHHPGRRPEGPHAHRAVPGPATPPAGPSPGRCSGPGTTARAWSWATSCRPPCARPAAPR